MTVQVAGFPSPTWATRRELPGLWGLHEQTGHSRVHALLLARSQINNVNTHKAPAAREGGRQRQQLFPEEVGNCSVPPRGPSLETAAHSLDPQSDGKDAQRGRSEQEARAPDTELRRPAFRGQSNGGQGTSGRCVTGYQSTKPRLQSSNTSHSWCTQEHALGAHNPAR